VMTRASGDRAVRMALNAYAHAARSNPRPARGRRHRVEHADLVHAADLPRFGSLSVIASMQPLRGSPTGARLQTWLETLGPERALETLPYGSILAADGRLAFGSGWPAGSLNPLLGIHAAVTRTTGDGLPEGGWNPAQRLSLEAAIDAYTSGAAWASFDEQRKGSLAPGMVLVGEDIRLAIEDGATGFDMLKGDYPYKYRFGATPRAVRRLLVTRA